MKTRREKQKHRGGILSEYLCGTVPGSIKMYSRNTGLLYL